MKEPTAQPEHMLPLQLQTRLTTEGSVTERRWGRCGEEGVRPQAALGTQNDTVFMPASRTLIFQVEIRGYIALGNSVGNMNCTLRRLQCENSDTGLNDGHACTLLAASENRRSLCLIVKVGEFILQQPQQNPPTSSRECQVFV